MTNDKRIWLAAAVIWTAIVASIAAPPRSRPIEVACAPGAAAN